MRSQANYARRESNLLQTYMKCKSRICSQICRITRLLERRIICTSGISEKVPLFGEWISFFHLDIKPQKKCEGEYSTRQFPTQEPQKHWREECRVWLSGPPAGTLRSRPGSCDLRDHVIGATAGFLNWDSLRFWHSLRPKLRLPFLALCRCVSWSFYNNMYLMLID